MRCVTIATDGVLIDVDPQPVDWSTCAFVLQSGAEAGANPFYLSAEDGAQIAWAIVLLWMGAFAMRAITKSLKEGNSHAE